MAKKSNATARDNNNNLVEAKLGFDKARLGFFKARLGFDKARLGFDKVIVKNRQQNIIYIYIYIYINRHVTDCT